MKKKSLTIVGTLGAIGAVAAIATSCGTAAAKSSIDDKYIAVIKQGDKTIGSIALTEYLKKLKSSKTDASKKVEDIIKKSVKWLYEQEVKGSEHMKKIREAEMTDKEKKDAALKSLDTVSTIKKRVESEFNDEKKAFKNAHGHGYEDAWTAELSKNAKYGGATSDQEAIENMVTAQMGSQAYLRYKLSKDSTTWTKADVERGNPAGKKKNQKDWEWLWNLKKDGFVYSSDKSSTYAQLTDKDHVIVVSTTSFDVKHKNPTELIGDTGKNGYINKYDPMFINHFLIPAVPDAKSSLAPWKIKIADAKKWLMSSEKTTPKAGLDTISTFKGLTVSGTSPSYKFEVSDDDETLLKVVAGNQPGTQKTGGSLGLKDELSYMASMVPGFGLPLLNSEIKSGTTPAPTTTTGTTTGTTTKKPTGTTTGTTGGTTGGTGTTTPAKKTTTTPAKKTTTTPKTTSASGSQFEIEKKDPFVGLSKKILDALQKKVDGKTWVAPATSKEWAKQLSALLSLVGDKEAEKIIGREFRDAFGNSTGNNKERYLTYEMSATNKAVVSKFGIHIINTHKVKDRAEIIAMLKSDVTRSTAGDAAFFNVVNELNQFAADKMLVVKSLLNDKDFSKWLITQPNYTNKPNGNTYPNYSQQDIDKLTDTKIGFIAGYEKTQVNTRVKAAVKNILPWVDASHKNETLVVPGADAKAKQDFWTKSIDVIYNTAKEIAKEGLVK